MDVLGPSDFENIVSNLHDGLYFTDRNRKILYWNRAAEQITGFTSQEVVGRSCLDNLLCHIDAEGVSLCKGLCPLASSILDGRAREADVFLHHKDGHRVPVMVRTNPLRSSQGKITGAIELFSITSTDSFLWDKLQEMQRVALIDLFTNLPNRKYLELHLNSQAAQLDRFQLPFGIASFHIENSKGFIEQHGVDAFQKLLKILADTIRHSLRPYDVVGVIDVDEFLGIYPNVDTFALHTICRRLSHLIMNSTIRLDDGSQLGFSLLTKACIAMHGEGAGALLSRLESSQLSLKT